MFPLFSSVVWWNVKPLCPTLTCKSRFLWMHIISTVRAIALYLLYKTIPKSDPQWSGQEDKKRHNSHWSFLELSLPKSRWSWTFNSSYTLFVNRYFHEVSFPCCVIFPQFPSFFQFLCHIIFNGFFHTISKIIKS